MVSWALPVVRSPVLQSWVGKSLLHGAGAGIPAHMQGTRAGQQHNVGCGTGEHWGSEDGRYRVSLGGAVELTPLPPPCHRCPASVNTCSSTYFVIVIYNWGPRANCSSK